MSGGKRVRRGNKAKDPNRVPLGSGLADRAKNRLRNRNEQIDSIVDSANDTLQERDIPRE